MVRVSLSEPILISELRTMLASLLDAEVRERGNRLEIVFSASAELEPAAQVARVQRLAAAWRARYPHVRAQVAFV
jgi:hypothetical protein